jgi:hypothetical protein
MLRTKVGMAVSFKEERTHVEAIKGPIASEPEWTALIPGTELETPPAWEEIEKGRFRPRRIRGSLLGRELG